MSDHTYTSKGECEMREEYSIPEMKVFLYDQRNIITDSNTKPWVDDNTDGESETEGW